MELGLHIADFTWQGGAPALAENLVTLVKDAESAGVRRITVMDHLWQIAGVGPEEHEMLEAYTVLGFLAAHTERVLLHTLVTGVVYREPGLLAKAVTTLDVLSGGRAGLGVGAAWFEGEAKGLGLPFPAVSERFERLEETVRICLQMWSGDESPFEGSHYRLGRTLNQPAALSTPRPYLLIGGSGERKTLRLVAQYADACNLFPGPDVQHKLDVLKRHCDEVGRDYADVEKTAALLVAPGTTRSELLKQLGDLRAQGFTAVYLMVPNASDPRPTVDLVASVVADVTE
jgi:F420-dependent oxidoreductase-like protein